MRQSLTDDSASQSKVLDSLQSPPRSIRIASWILLGWGLCFFVSLGRSPGLFKGLWEDEVHYHYAIFYSHNFRELRHDINWLYRPLLEFLLRKYLWFSSFGFSINERNLALVSLIYAAIHLLIWFFVPWTSNKLLRVAVVFLLGYSSLESHYSTEAQGYSFISLSSSVAFFSSAAAAMLWQRHKGFLAWLVWISGITLCLNAHFFSWPMGLILVGLSMLYVLDSGDKGSFAISWMGLSFVVLVGFSVLLNWPSLELLLSEPPKANAEWQWQWGNALGFLNQGGSCFSFPIYFFLPLILPGFAHPSRLKRYLWSAAILAIFPLKLLVVLLAEGVSSYAIGDRYLIMFLGPSLLAVALGMDSLLLNMNLRNSFRKYGPVLAGTFLGIVVCACLPQIQSGLEDSKTELRDLMEKPSNGSKTFLFYEALKDLKGPVLILSDHCFASDIPKLYHEYLGRPSSVSWEILNTNGVCETSPAELRSSVLEFLRRNRGRGELVYDYDWDPNRAIIPCPPAALWEETESDWPCVGTLKRRAGENYLRQNLVNLDHGAP
jgi:hypothetical protein